MLRFAFLGVWPYQRDDIPFLLDGQKSRESIGQFTFGAGDGDDIALGYLQLDTSRQRDRRSSDTRHNYASLPDIADHFAAQPLLVGLATCHHALGRGDNCGAQPAAHPGNVITLGIDAQAWLAHPLELRDDRTLVYIAEHDPNRSLWAIGILRPAIHIEISDVAFLFENGRDGDLHLGGRYLRSQTTRHDRVANARQHICDRISHIHRSALPLTTSSTWSRRAVRHGAHAHGSRCGRGQTCACTRADGHRCCTDCAAARGILACAGTSRSSKSLPSLPPPGRGAGLWRAVRPIRALCAHIDACFRAFVPLDAVSTDELSCRAERHTEQAEQAAPFLVGAGGRHDGDLHAAHLVYLVVVNLREDQLFFDAQGIVAAPVESVG